MVIYKKTDYWKGWQYCTCLHDISGRRLTFLNEGDPLFSTKWKDVIAAQNLIPGSVQGFPTSLNIVYPNNDDLNQFSYKTRGVIAERSMYGSCHQRPERRRQDYHFRDEYDHQTQELSSLGHSGLMSLIKKIMKRSLFPVGTRTRSYHWMTDHFSF
jgi:hypothetical protein